MPDRLDTVTVALSRGDVTIGWEMRQALMAHCSTYRAPRTSAPHSKPSPLPEPSSSTPPSEQRSWACSTNGRSTATPTKAMPERAHRTPGRAQRRPRRPRVAQAQRQPPDHPPDQATDVRRALAELLPGAVGAVGARARRRPSGTPASRGRPPPTPRRTRRRRESSRRR